MRVLPGHPPWGAEADTALAQVALARGEQEEAAQAARSALGALQSARFEDLSLHIVVPAARVLIATGTEEERATVQHQVTLVAALIAQRITDESIRVQWFRGPVGRELSRIAGGSPGQRSNELAADREPAAELGDDDTRLLWLLIEGWTNREIAAELGMSEEAVARRLVEMYAKIGVSSRGQAAMFAFREGVV
jgi:DNA-binding NarL/FixJ family response regulator